MSSDLAGKKVVITGGSQGLGLELSRGFLEAGASVAICGRDAKMLENAKAALSNVIKPGASFVSEVADISKPADVDRFTKTVLKPIPL